MTDDLTGRLRSTTEQMANRCSVDAHLWNVHSNAALEAANEIERLRMKNSVLCTLLSNFHVMVWGECPSLLDEDRGGDAEFDIKIREALGYD